MISGKNLENVVKLFKEGKITKYVLEKELTNAIESHIDSRVVIAEDDTLQTNSTYIGQVIPKKVNDKFYLTYYIDPRAIMNFLTEEEIVDMLFALYRNSQKTINQLSRFLVSKKDMDIDLLDSILFLLSIMKNNILNGYCKKSFYKRLEEQGSTVSIDQIDEEIEKIETSFMPVETIVEGLKVRDIMPVAIINEARELSKRSFEEMSPEEKAGYEIATAALNDYNLKNPELVATEVVEYNGNPIPPFNGLTNKEISPDYTPETNQ